MKKISLVIVALLWSLTVLPAEAQQDTSMAGREGEGMTDQTGAAGMPDSGSMQAEMGADTSRMAGDDMDGGAMPTTASPLPLVAGAGALLLALGIALRYRRSRS